MTSRLVRPSAPTRMAALISGLAIAVTAAFLLVRYPALPDILPVRFGRGGFPIGWQYRTISRVLMPVYVQLALLTLLGTVSTLVLSRPHGERDADAPDVRTAAAAAEAIALIAAVWIVFQAYAAVALASMWQAGHEGLGVMYTVLEVTCAVASAVIFARAQLLFGTPGPRPYVAEHWRYGQLYKNAMDPALFVPTRDGRRWTLNFGRPVAAALMGIVLGAGVVAPAAILGLLLR
jgi:uncharacterized membrane protein